MGRQQTSERVIKAVDDGEKARGDLKTDTVRYHLLKNYRQR